MNDATTILGWNVGGTGSSAVVGTADGRILARRSWPSRAERGPEAMLGEFLAQAADLRAGFSELAAVGVSIGGPMNALTGEILGPPHLPGWDSVPLKELLESSLHLEAVVEHDAAACLLAEWFWGAASGATHAAYLTCGTGFGAGLMIDRRIVRGPGGRSAEFGHVRLAPDGPVMFGKAGCAESFCSGAGIARLAPWLFPESFDGPVEPERLVELAAGGDPAASEVLAESGRRTGQAAAVLADLFCPQVVVLGPLARRFGGGWLDFVRGEFAREALPDNVRQTRIAPHQLDDLQDLSPVAACRFRMEA